MTRGKAPVSYVSNSVQADTHRRVKKAAAVENTAIRTIIEDALQEWLTRFDKRQDRRELAAAKKAELAKAVARRSAEKKATTKKAVAKPATKKGK